MPQNIFVTVAIGDLFQNFDLTVLSSDSKDDLFTRIALAVAREFDPSADAATVAVNLDVEVNHA